MCAPLTVHQPLPDGLSVRDLLEEASVILDSLNAESVVLGSDSVDEVVVRDLVAINSSLDGRVVCGLAIRLASLAGSSRVDPKGLRAYRQSEQSSWWGQPR